MTEKPQEGVNKALLAAGVGLLLACAVAAVVLSRRKPCGCGDKDVTEVAQASAQIAKSNRKAQDVIPQPAEGIIE